MKNLYNFTYRGIIVQNDDPEMMGRCKVYIPSISMTLDKNWQSIRTQDKMFTTIGSNVNCSITPELLVRLKNSLPWASIKFPVFGMGTNTFYNNDTNFSEIANDENNSKQHVQTNEQPGSSDPSNNVTTQLQNAMPSISVSPSNNAAILNNYSTNPSNNSSTSSSSNSNSNNNSNSSPSNSNNSLTTNVPSTPSSTAAQDIEAQIIANNNLVNAELSNNNGLIVNGITLVSGVTATDIAGTNNSETESISFQANARNAKNYRRTFTTSESVTIGNVTDTLASNATRQLVVPTVSNAITHFSTNVNSVISNQQLVNSSIPSFIYNVPIALQTIPPPVFIETTTSLTNNSLDNNEADIIANTNLINSELNNNQTLDINGVLLQSSASATFIQGTHNSETESITFAPNGRNAANANRVFTSSESVTIGGITSSTSSNATGARTSISSSNSLSNFAANNSNVTTDDNINGIVVTFTPNGRNARNVNRVFDTSASVSTNDGTSNISANSQGELGITTTSNTVTPVPPVAPVLTPASINMSPPITYTNAANASVGAVSVATAQAADSINITFVPNALNNANSNRVFTTTCDVVTSDGTNLSLAESAVGQKTSANYSVQGSQIQSIGIVYNNENQPVNLTSSRLGQVASLLSSYMNVPTSVNGTPVTPPATVSSPGYNRGGSGSDIFSLMFSNLLPLSNIANCLIKGVNPQNKSGLNYRKQQSPQLDPNKTVGSNIQTPADHLPPIRACTQGNKVKGMISIPAVGSHVSVYFDNGDPNYPIIDGIFYSQEDFKAVHDVNINSIND